MNKGKQKKTMTEEQGKLVTSREVKTYVKSIAQKFSRWYPSVGYDEFYAEAIAAVCEQAMLYNPEKDASFLTYFTMYVTGTLTQYVERYVTHQFLDKHQRFFMELISIEDLRTGDENEDIAVDEILSARAIDEDDRQRMIRERLDTLLEQLSESDREIITIRYGFFDNQGDTLRLYLECHNMQKTAFYAKAAEVEVKMKKLYRKMVKEKKFNV